MRTALCMHLVNDAHLHEGFGRAADLLDLLFKFSFPAAAGRRLWPLLLLLLLALLPQLLLLLLQLLLPLPQLLLVQLCRADLVAGLRRLRRRRPRNLVEGISGGTARVTRLHLQRRLGLQAVGLRQADACMSAPCT